MRTNWFTVIGMFDEAFSVKNFTITQAESLTSGKIRFKLFTLKTLFEMARRRFHRIPLALNTLANSFVSGSPSFGGN